MSEPENTGHNVTHVEKKLLLFQLLKQRTFWFIRLRWLVPPCMALGVGIALWAGFEFYWQAVLFVALFILGYNCVFFVLYYFLIKKPKPNLRIFTAFQSGMDYLAMFLLIHFTGGISSPMILFFIFPIILSALLLRGNYAWGFASLAAIEMSTIALLEYLEVFSWHGISLGDVSYGLMPSAPMHVAVLLLFFVAAVYITAYLSTSIMEVFRARVVDLSKSHEAIEELNQLRDRYLLQVAHNLKEPLATSIDMMNVLNRGYMGDLNPKQKEYVERMDSRLKMMISMIQELLTLSRTREDIRRLKIEPVDIKAVCEHLGLIYMEKARNKGLAFLLELPEESVSVNVDKSMIEQMIENLISNAVKYTETGNVEVKLRHSIGGGVVLQVKDSGIGIPEEDMKHLFTDFFRAGNARQVSAFGTGLGLSLVKQTVEQHGGKIEVFSEIGKGSLFTVKLPSHEK